MTPIRSTNDRPRCLRRGCHQFRAVEGLGLGLCRYHDRRVATRQLGWNPSRNTPTHWDDAALTGTAAMSRLEQAELLDNGTP